MLVGKSIAVAEAKVRSASGKLVAAGTASFLNREVGWVARREAEPSNRDDARRRLLRRFGRHF
jgi:hypothetical protein